MAESLSICDFDKVGNHTESMKTLADAKKLLGVYAKTADKTDKNRFHFTSELLLSSSSI
jgi:hypothetical protein